MSTTSSAEKIKNGYDSEFLDKADQVKQDVKQLGRLAYDRASEKASELKEAGKEKISDIKTIGEDKMSEVEDYILNNPLKAMAYAVGAGLLIGKLFSKSTNRKN
ncbi:MAG: hypothetical protein KDD56_10910 [Bdellovibrionales bacterium]|nr:hypothetical protein [Bdellovibrionales bacterium]